MKRTKRLACAFSGSSLLPMAVFAFFSFACVGSVSAGGSIGWDEVKARISKEDPFLAAFITEHFKVRHAGGAVRVGHDSDGNSTVPGLEVGTRLPPYEFSAKPKGTEGDYTLYITLEPTSFDDGKTWQMTIRKKRATD